MFHYMKILILQASLIILIGCSQNTLSPDVNPLDSTNPARRNDNTWQWGNYRIIISEDLTRAEVVPKRGANVHLNVTQFVEEDPCPACLVIQNPIPRFLGSLGLPVLMCVGFSCSRRRIITEFTRHRLWTQNIIF